MTTWADIIAASLAAGDIDTDDAERLAHPPTPQELTMTTHPIPTTIPVRWDATLARWVGHSITVHTLTGAVTTGTLNSVIPDAYYPTDAPTGIILTTVTGATIIIPWHGINSIIIALDDTPTDRTTPELKG